MASADPLRRQRNRGLQDPQPRLRRPPERRRSPRRRPPARAATDHDRCSATRRSRRRRPQRLSRRRARPLLPGHPLGCERPGGEALVGHGPVRSPRDGHHGRQLPRCLASSPGGLASRARLYAPAAAGSQVSMFNLRGRASRRGDCWSCTTPPGSPHSTRPRSQQIGASAAKRPGSIHLHRAATHHTVTRKPVTRTFPPSKGGSTDTPSPDRARAAQRVLNWVCYTFGARAPGHLRRQTARPEPSIGGARCDLPLWMLRFYADPCECRLRERLCSTR